MKTVSFKAITKICSVVLAAVLLLSVIPLSVGAAVTTKTLSDNGYSLIKSYEGCRLTAYKAHSSEEYYTIGWGHYGPDVKEGQTITKKQADDLLVSDMQDYISHLNDFARKYNQNYSQNQFDALISFTYNLGWGWMSNTNYSIFKFMSGKDKYTADEISDTFTSWCHAGGEVLPGLYNRRQTEAALFLTPDSTPYEVWEVTTDLNLRKSATTSSESFGTIDQNTKIIITAGNDQRKNGGYLWGKTRYYNGKTSNVGWCAISSYAKWLYGSIYENTKPTTTKPTTTTTTTTTTTKPTTTTNAATTKPTTTQPATQPTAKPTTQPTVAPTTVTTTSPVPTTTKVYTYPFRDNPTLGDANNDGSVNMKDILIMRKYIANYDIDLIELKDAENHPKSYIVLEYTDINSDKLINMKDVLFLRKHIAGIDVAY